MSEPVGRLYVVVDSSLRGGSVAAQSIHAVVEFSKNFPEDFENWHSNGNTIVVLKHDNLRNLEAKLRHMEFDTAPFFEPDWEGEPMTAFAVVPHNDVQYVLSDLKVATGAPEKKKSFFKNFLKR